MWAVRAVAPGAGRQAVKGPHTTQCCCARLALAVTASDAIRPLAESAPTWASIRKAEAGPQCWAGGYTLLVAGDGGTLVTAAPVADRPSPER